MKNVSVPVGGVPSRVRHGHEPLRNIRRSVAFPVAGAVLAAGAPLGLLCMRRYALRHDLALREDIRRDRATYGYIAASTLIVFTLIGRALGRYADRLAMLSVTDSLTGLLNARAFHARLQAEVERSKRSRAPITLLVIDLDYLKAINDRHGHAMGDRALETIARAIRHEMRSIDAAGRLGGDEFALLAVGSGARDARIVADRLRETIRGQAGGQFRFPVTASIGLVTFDPEQAGTVDAGDLAHAADAALYAAKRGGRDRVEAGPLEPGGR